MFSLVPRTFQAHATFKEVKHAPGNDRVLRGHIERRRPRPRATTRPGFFIARAIVALVLPADWLPGLSYLQALFSWFWF
jgi:hypothetical protein